MSLRSPGTGSCTAEVGDHRAGKQEVSAGGGVWEAEP